MSVDYYSYLVAGVKVSEVLREEVTIAEVTKYNENTGEPYKVRNEIKRQFIGAIELTSMSIGEAVEQHELEAFSQCSESNEELIGITIEMVSNYQWVRQIDNLSSEMAVVNQKLRDIGIDIPAQLYLVQQVSY